MGKNKDQGQRRRETPNAQNKQQSSTQPIFISAEEEEEQKTHGHKGPQDHAVPALSGRYLRHQRVHARHSPDRHRQPPGDVVERRVLGQDLSPRRYRLTDHVRHHVLRVVEPGLFIQQPPRLLIHRTADGVVDTREVRCLSSLRVDLVLYS